VSVGTDSIAVPATRAGDRERMPFVVPMLAGGTFLMSTSENIVAGLLQPMAADLHVSVPRVGLLITAFAFGMIIGAPTMALATRRLPRRATLMAALIVFALGHVIAGLSSSFALVLVARVVTAVATGAFWSVAASVATTAAGPRRASRALGIVMTGVGLATVAGVPLGSFAGQLIGWRGAFWALAILAAAAAVIIGRLTPPDPAAEPAPLRTELAAVTTKRLLLLVIATIVITGASMGAFAYVSPLLTDRTGLPDWAVPIGLVVFGIGALFGTNVAGRFADTRPLTTYVVAAAGIGVVLALMLPLSAFTVPTLVLLGLLGVTGMGVPPVATGLASAYASAAPTLAAAVAVAAFNLGIALSSWVGAEALDGPLGVLAPEWLGILLSAVGLIVLAVLGMVTRRDR
jgi:predicted MFS family arabinose efflux permease